MALETNQLPGTAELTAALRSLPELVEKKALRASASAGAKVVRAQVKQFAPIAQFIHRRRGRLVAPGVLRRAITMKYAKEKSGPGKASYIVTLRRGKKEQKGNRDAYYWTWVEEGHRIVPRASKGGGTIRARRKVAAAKGGRVPAHPFFVPAYRASSSAAASTMQSTLEQQVRIIINGLNARSGG